MCENNICFGNFITTLPYYSIFREYLYWKGEIEKRIHTNVNLEYSARNLQVPQISTNDVPYKLINYYERNTVESTIYKHSLTWFKSSSSS